MPEITQTLYVTTPKQWREWLEKNHQTASDIWLIFPHKDTGKPRIGYNEAIEEALCFGWIDSIVKTYNSSSSVQRFSPRKDKTNWSQPNIERLRWLDSQGKLTPTVRQSVIHLLSQPFVFPKDILSALNKNPVAKKNFNASSQTYQRIRVAYVDGARQRPQEFQKRLKSFILAAEKNQIVGFGGIEKYY